MTVLNPNINFPEKNKKNKIEQKRRGGGVTTTNVKWSYDFRPIRNFIVILTVSAAIIAGYFYLQKQKRSVVLYENIEKEAEEVKKRYHEKVLEKLKNETIAAERLKRDQR